MATVSQIAANLTFKGQGVVQFNGSEKPFAKVANAIMTDIHKNNQYAKKVFKKVGEEKDEKTGLTKPILEEHLCVTADGLRHAAHKKEQSMLNPSVFADHDTAVEFLTDIGSIERGFVSTQGDFSGFKKKSAYAITDALEVSGATPFLGIHGNSQPKTKKEADDEKGGTSLFSREQVGETEYKAKLFIDIDEARFLSSSRWHDRQAFNASIDAEYHSKLKANFDKVFNKLNKKYNFGFTLPELPATAWYTRNGDVSAKAEQGILLPAEYVVVLIYDILDKYSRIWWTKSQSGYLKSHSVEVAAVSGLEEENFADLKNFKLNPADIENNFTLTPEGEKFWKAVEEAEAKANAAAKKAKADKKAAKTED